LNVPVVKNWRSDASLKPFDKVNRGVGVSNGRHHQTQRCASILVIVDLKNVSGAAEGRDQLIELLPIIQTVDFEPNG